MQEILQKPEDMSGQQELSEQQYRRGRRLFIADSCASVQIFTATSGAFLSGLAYLAGAGTALVGIIAALPTLMNAVQILSSIVYENRRSSKKIIVGVALLQRICLVLMLFVPTFSFGQNMAVGVIAVLYSCAHFCGAFINTGANNWLMSLAEKSKLGQFLGVRDSVVLVASTAGSLVLSKIMDEFRGNGQEVKGFFIIGIICIVFCVIDIVCLSLIIEPRNPQLQHSLKLKEAVLKPLLDVNYRKVLVFFLIWSIASNLASPFFSIYMLNNLGLSYFYITMIGMVSSAGRIIASIVWGRIADTYSWNLVTVISIVMLGASYLGWSVMGENNYMYCLPAIQCISGIAWGGIGITTFRMQFEYAPKEHRVSYVSFCSTMAGIVGFFASMSGSGIIMLLDEVKVLTYSISNIQLIFLLSGVGILISAVYSHKMKEKMYDASYT